MKHMNFVIRVVNLLLIVVFLLAYQRIAASRAAAVSERNAQIAEVEAYNTAILQAAQPETEQQEQSGIRDGVYEGSGLGFGDTITVSVTIEDGKMTDIVVLNADGEDRPYYTQALTVLDEILSAQSTEVDTISGATLTAEGMIEAVADALEKAVS